MIAAIATTPRLTPIPMPILLPVLRPWGVAVDEAEVKGVAVDPVDDEDDVVDAPTTSASLTP